MGLGHPAMSLYFTKNLFSNDVFVRNNVLAVHLYVILSELFYISTAWIKTQWNMKKNMLNARGGVLVYYPAGKVIDYWHDKSSVIKNAFQLHNKELQPTSSCSIQSCTFFIMWPFLERIREHIIIWKCQKCQSLTN